VPQVIGAKLLQSESMPSSVLALNLIHNLQDVKDLLHWPASMSSAKIEAMHTALHSSAWEAQRTSQVRPDTKRSVTPEHLNGADYVPPTHKCTSSNTCLSSLWRLQVQNAYPGYAAELQRLEQQSTQQGGTQVILSLLRSYAVCAVGLLTFDSAAHLLQWPVCNQRTCCWPPK
jgi:hypothetical protein